MRVELVLSDDQVDAIARRVAELLASSSAPPLASELLTVREAAEFLRCSRQRVDNLLSQGRLPRVKEGRRTLIARAALARYLAGGGCGGGGGGRPPPPGRGGGGGGLPRCCPWGRDPGRGAGFSDEWATAIPMVGRPGRAPGEVS